jgi:acetyltransferase-like isoleucine patch superfamily enzyme
MGQLTLGRHSYSFAERRGTDNNVTIGSFSSVAINTVFDGGYTHNTRFISTFPFHAKMERCSHIESNCKAKGDIVIGHDVTIGEGVTLMAGICVGNGAIIGTKAVVTHDVAPYSIVGGVPAIEIRKRFSHEQIEKLLSIAWWDWSDEKIIENAHLLQSDNIWDFINKHYKQK